MKRCPFCAEEIKEAAIKCRFCGEDIPQAPNSSGEAPGLDADQPAEPPSHQASTGTPSRRVIGGAIAAAVLLILILAGRLGGGRSDQTGVTTTTETLSTVSALQEALAPWNRGGPPNYKGAVRNFGAYPDARCWAGFDRDFPDRVIILVIRPNGLWVTFSPMADGNVETGSFEAGEDYQLAGIDPQALDQSGAVSCTVLADGSISVA